MTSEGLVIPLREKAAGYPWAIWRAQLLTILRLELKRNFFQLRGFWIYLLAFAPVAITGLTQSPVTAAALLKRTPLSSLTFSSFITCALGSFSGAWGSSRGYSAVRFLKEACTIIFWRRSGVKFWCWVNPGRCDCLVSFWSRRHAIVRLHEWPFWGCRTAVCLNGPGWAILVPTCL